MAGRKSKYTPDRVEIILKAIENTGGDRAGVVWDCRFDRVGIKQ